MCCIKSFLFDRGQWPLQTKHRIKARLWRLYQLNFVVIPNKSCNETMCNKPQNKFYGKLRSEWMDVLEVEIVKQINITETARKSKSLKTELSIYLLLLISLFSRSHKFQIKKNCYLFASVSKNWLVFGYSCSLIIIVRPYPKKKVSITWVVKEMLNRDELVFRVMK